MNRYLIGVLYYGGIDREHDQCVQALKHHPQILDTFDLYGCPYIDQGRSMIATRVLDQPEAGGLLFIDHDMVFDVAEAIKVIDAAEACRGVAGAAYSMRRPGRMIGGIDGKKLPEGKKVVFFEGGESLPASYLGMGMTAIHRSVFERLVKASDERYARQQANVKALEELLLRTLGTDGDGREAGRLLGELLPELREPDLPRLCTGLNDAPVIPFFSHLRRLMDGTPAGTVGTYFGEDVSFCVRCHEADVPVALETRARVFHKGSYHYGIEDVGMQVPFCDRLEAIDPGTPDPAVKPAFYSQDEGVQRELDREHAPEPLRAREPSAEEATA